MHAIILTKWKKQLQLKTQCLIGDLIMLQNKVICSGIVANYPYFEETVPIPIAIQCYSSKQIVKMGVSVPISSWQLKLIRMPN